MISSKGIYGLSAVFELHLLKREGPVQIKELVANTKIPQAYLEQLFNTLKKANILKSIRGAKGGYKLGMPANAILVLDILQALEGDLLFCEMDAKNSVLQSFWDDRTQALHEILQWSLEDLEKYKDELEQVISYDI